ncbi:MAG: SUMF1/EgtB/PvdO family nonheme iron enzyme [Acidobacteria bacterium]|nr:SUMF1/EgtB/PvdO family nonheme iron enzyme [Acidobacteriota bacterium]
MKPWLPLSPVLLFSVFLFLACSKQKEAPPAETTTQEAAELEVVPGEMVKIPGGEFIMGSDIDPKGGNKRGSYSPAHKVNLPDYWIDKYEVTNGQFLKFVTESDYKPEGDWRTIYRIGMENYPVANVTLSDAKAFCQWAGKRLPAEEEWEKAARGAQGQDYPWGNGWEAGRADTYEAGIRERVEVGKMVGDVSPLGVHDSMGNVQEWTASEYQAYPNGPKDPAYKTGRYAVRGASYALYGNDKDAPFKIWVRSAFFPKSQFGIGFRCASDTEPKR